MIVRTLTSLPFMVAFRTEFATSDERDKFFTKKSITSLGFNKISDKEKSVDLTKKKYFC